jgi:hypothetical protein
MKTKLGVVLAFGIIALAFSCGKKAENTESASKDSTTTQVDTTAKAETPKDTTSTAK